MRKIIIVLALFLSLFAGHAQNADMRIYELVNSSNWFTLAKEYPQLKDSIQYDFVRLMAEAMLKYFGAVRVYFICDEFELFVRIC